MGFVAKFFIDSIISPITFGLFSVAWYLFVLLPYNAILLIDWLKKVLGINLIKKILIGEATSLENIELPYFLIIFLAISLIMTIVFVVISIFKNNISTKGHIKIAIKNGIMALIIIWFIPVVLFLSLSTLEIINGIISETIINKGTSASSEINYIFRELKPSYISDNEWNRFADNDFTTTESIYKSYLDFSWGQGTLLVLQMSLIAFSLLVGLFYGVFIVTMRLIVIYLNIIFAPVMVSISPLDDGKAFKKVLKELQTSFVIILGFELLIKIYFLYILTILKIRFSFTENEVLLDFAFFLLKFVLIAGASWGIYKIGQKINTISPAKAGNISKIMKLTSAIASGNPTTISSSLSNFSNSSISPLKQQNSIKNDTENEDFKIYDNQRNYLDLIKSKASNFKDNTKELLNHFIPKKG